MRILVTSPGEFSGDYLEPGEVYEVSPYVEGTLRQNAAFHALMEEYFVTGMHSYNAYSLEHFKQLIKLYLGEGAEAYYSTVDPLTGAPLPSPQVFHRTKSWKHYTKKQRTATIEKLIAEMISAGVNTRKFEEILTGMERERDNKHGKERGSLAELAGAP